MTMVRPDAAITLLLGLLLLGLERIKVGGVIRTADQGTAGYVGKSLFPCDVPVELKGLRINVLHHRKVLWGGAKVLSHRQKFDVVLAEIVHRLKNFGLGFSQTQHETALGHRLGSDLLGPLQKLEGKMVLSPRAYHGGEALNRLEVVIENVRGGIEDGSEGFVLAVEVGNQHLNDDCAIATSDCLDGLGKVEGSPIRHIVSSHRGDDDMFQIHPHDSLGHPLGFVRFEGKGFGGGDGTKSAGAGAAVTGNHEGSRTLAPAFPAVGTLSAFADGVEAKVRDQFLGGEKDRVGGQTHLDPVWLFHLM